MFFVLFVGFGCVFVLDFVLVSFSCAKPFGQSSLRQSGTTVACMVLPLTSVKRYYRPPQQYYHYGAGDGGYVGAGGVSFLPHTHSPHSLVFLVAPATSRRRRASAGRRLCAVPPQFLQWSRSPPHPLAMDVSIAPILVLFLPRSHI